MSRWKKKASVKAGVRPQECRGLSDDLFVDSMFIIRLFGSCFFLPIKTSVLSCEGVASIGAALTFGVLRRPGVLISAAGRLTGHGATSVDDRDAQSSGRNGLQSLRESRVFSHQTPSL